MTYPSHSTRVIWLTTALALAAPTSPREAAAQGVDPGTAAKVPPNVLLIVDTSGSMEYMAGQDNYPTCTPGVASTQRSRWIDVVEVLSGTIQNYSCRQIDRSSTEFANLYRMGSTNQYPPDWQYRNPYHRPLSGTCGATPSTVPWSVNPSNAFDWVEPAFHPWNDNVGTCSFTQDPDGLIDTFSGSVRFGLMTFDTLPDPGKGHTSVTPDFSTGVAGAWSYFFSGSVTGWPAGCGTNPPMEVGARNGAAPTWEGRMIAFGNPAATGNANTTRDSHIQRVLLSTRPYGATPIAGALTDAQTFLTLDNTGDPTTSPNDGLWSTNYGPKDDPYVLAGCRDQYVILLTDGEPNLDLRPDCEPATGKCPYSKSPEVAAALKTGARPIKTYVVGFAATTAGAVDCKTMNLATAWSAGGTCRPTPPATLSEELRACCALHEIASAGGTTRAFFGDNKTTLRTELSAVFNEILSGGGSGTQPVRSPGVGDSEASPGSIAFRMLTSYEGSTTGVWRGTLERSRWTCDAGAPVEQPKDATVGDDFSYNVNKNPTARTFVTYVPTASSSSVYMRRSIRPNISSAAATADGIGKNDGAAYTGDRTAIINAVVPEVFAPPNVTLGTSPCVAPYNTSTTCKDLLLPWFLGGDNGTTSPKYHRCASPATSPTDPNCSVIGDIMHSTPVIVDHPTAEIEDETYTAFRFTSNAKDRPMMVYTSSNDGFLHGFKLSPNKAAEASITTNASNEIFAFIPPAIFPLIASEYPRSHQKLLDGAPVVQDVVATQHSANTYYPYKLERANSAAQTASSTLAYRTVLVQAFGGANSGYFAVDITEPTHATNSGTFNTVVATQPRLLWQLTTDSADNALFGERAGTPLITTLNVGGVETAVAILPGGYGSPTGSPCNRAQMTGYTQIPDNNYAPRQNVRCYTNASYIGARSVTIVRLDSGEVITRFRRSASEGFTFTGSASAKITVAALDSPITGAPAAYPVGPGAVSDRIFVGDQDGTVWRIDTSSPTVSQWTMTLFFDTYSKHPGVGTPSVASTAGRPIITAPTLSIDDFGQITVAVATGDQDLSGSNDTVVTNVGPDKQYVWSLTEQYNTATPNYRTLVNWYQELSNGEHVLGPVRLNEGILYYSTFVPDFGNTNECVLGTSTVYGVDYLTGNGTAGGGGLGRLSLSTLTAAATNKVTAAEMGLPVGAVIFGVNLEYAPTCFSEGSVAAAMLGGNHLSPSAASASRLQLTFQTGAIGGTKAPLGFKTGFEAVGLNRPLSGATVESWAAILE